jgi:hypothetical protein
MSGDMKHCTRACDLDFSRIIVPVVLLPPLRQTSRIPNSETVPPPASACTGYLNKRAPAHSNRSTELLKLIGEELLPFLIPFVLGLLPGFPSELMWNYGSYRQLVGLLGRVISPIARPLPTQHKMNTEETRTDSHATNGIRIHDPSVWRGEDISCLDLAATVIGREEVKIGNTNDRIGKQRLMWCGYIRRMECVLLPSQAFEWSQIGPRKRGRLRWIWDDEVTELTRERGLSVEGSENRERWKLGTRNPWGENNSKKKK